MLRKEALKENFSERNPVDNLGETPLHLAAQKGHIEVCQLIIDNVEVSTGCPNSNIYVSISSES